MSAQDCILEKMRLFTSKELENATDQFSKSRILGQGGQGTVYKGMLSDGRIIEVKKSKQENKNQLQEFINEVVILSRVNQRNLVKLLGCCLETEVPLLIYEFIPNGTMYHLIHDHDSRFLLAMEENRLKAILDSQISEQGGRVEVIAASDLAKRCLNLKGKKRPNIREVAMELESIRTCGNSFLVKSFTQ